MLVLFRFRYEDADDDNKIKATSKDFVGLAYASSMRNLFWLIDELGDPYSCQVRKIPASRGAAMCIQMGYKDVSADCEEEDGTSFSPLPEHFSKPQSFMEFDERTHDDLTEEGGWHTPVWGKYL